MKNVNWPDGAKSGVMSPRAYQVGKGRQLATEATRSRIIAAARELLADPRASVFTVDAVAERADVARMTVYYQFKSKGKLLEALFDDFGARANMKDLRKAFQDPEPARGLNTLIDVFCHLWETERPLLRRLNAMAALDLEVDRALTERGSWRREAVSAMADRLELGPNVGEIVDLLYVLTSFETYDALATAHRTRRDVALLLHRAAAGILASFTGQ
jgi:AcrR family transcriptional regulator